VQTKYKVYLEAKGDIRQVAEIAQFYLDKGVVITSRNHLLNMILEDYSTLLVDNKLTEAIEELKEAEAVLERAKLTGLRRVTKYRQSLHIKLRGVEPRVGTGGKSVVKEDTGVEGALKVVEKLAQDEKDESL